MIFSPIFRKDFIAIRLEWYHIKLQEVFNFYRKSLFRQFFFIKTRQITKTHTPRNAKTLESFFWVFRTLLNDLCQIIVRLNTLTHPLRELLQKDVDFDWNETSNEAFEKLKLRYLKIVILKNLYIEYSLHRRQSVWSILKTLLQKQKRIDKDDHKTLSCCSRSFSTTGQ